MKLYIEDVDDGDVLADNRGDWWVVMRDGDGLWLREVYSGGSDHCMEITGNDCLVGFRKVQEF